MLKAEDAVVVHVGEVPSSGDAAALRDVLVEKKVYNYQLWPGLGRPVCKGRCLLGPDYTVLVSNGTVGTHHLLHLPVWFKVSRRLAKHGRTWHNKGCMTQHNTTQHNTTQHNMT